MTLDRQIIDRMAPCPFCGEKSDFMIASRLRKIRPYDKDFDQLQMDYWIECNGCGCKWGTNSAEIDQNLDNEHGYDYDFVKNSLIAIERLIIGWNRRAG